jgi:hypothetical protein
MADETSSQFITYEEAYGLASTFLYNLTQCRHSGVIYERLQECIKPIEKGNFNKAFSKTIEKGMFEAETALKFYLLLYGISIRVKDASFDTTEGTQLLATQYAQYIANDLAQPDDEEEDYSSEESDASDESDD